MRHPQETFWTATEICIEPDQRKRVLLIESFVRIARICKESYNFFSMFAIVGGLNLAPVQRLKRTWEVRAPLCSIFVFSA